MPIQCDLSNGVSAVVKYRNNDQSSKALVNEWIANNIAKQIGIEAPGFGMCRLTMDALVGPNVNPENFQLKEDHCGTAYYIEFVERATPFSQSACKRYNHAQLVKMMLLDHIIYNKDRSVANVIVPVGLGGTIYPIDYTHVFKNQTIWDRYTFRLGMAEDDYLDSQIIQSNADVYRPIFLHSCPCEDDFKQLVKDIPGQLTDSFIQSMMDLVPPEWLSDAALEMQDMVALKEYLLYRIAHVEKLANLIIEEGRKQGAAYH